MPPSPLTPTIRSLIYVANELSRAIDNIATCPWSNSLIPETLRTLSAQWHDYYTMISYLTRGEPFDITEYLICPDHLIKEEPVQ